jgi:hypothetical protein
MLNQVSDGRKNRFISLAMYWIYLSTLQYHAADSAGSMTEKFAKNIDLFPSTFKKGATLSIIARLLFAVQLGRRRGDIRRKIRQCFHCINP